MLDITEGQRILTTALRCVIKTMRYLDDYANLLQEYISSAELDAAFENFDEIVEKHSRSPRKISDEQIAREAKFILDVTGEELNSDELADILNLDVFVVEEALLKYSKK